MVVARLHGYLLEKDMKSDIRIQWQEFRQQFPVYFTEECAINAMLNWLVMIAMSGLTVIYALPLCCGKRKCVAAGWVLLAITLAILRFASASILGSDVTKVSYPHLTFSKFSPIG